MKTILITLDNMPDLKADKITHITSVIKDELDGYFLKALHLLLKRRPNKEIQDILKNFPIICLVAIKLHRYGVIYLISRSEAASYYHYCKFYSNELRLVYAYLQLNHRANRIINYAVHCFVRNNDARRVQHSNTLIPKNAFYSISENEICIREADFFSEHSVDVLYGSNNSRYDLHDFVHYIAASLNAKLYGSKYFNSLINLPMKLQDLIKSPGKNSFSPVQFSDGLVFSHLLTHLFNQPQYNQKNDDECVNSMALKISRYMMQQEALYHNEVKQDIYAKRPINVYELMTLAQNKSYEHTASEIERFVFTRGGIGEQDDLYCLGPMKKLDRINAAPIWFYFERRNTLKHRAHTQAYRIIANLILHHSNANIEKLYALCVLNNLAFQDWERGQRVNLWRIMHKHRIQF